MPQTHESCQYVHKEYVKVLAHMANPPRREDGTLIDIDIPATPQQCVQWHQLRAAAAFVHWMQRFALSSMYPGAPIERLGVALELLLAVAGTWGREGDQDGMAMFHSFDDTCDVRKTPAAWVNPLLGVLEETHSPQAVATLLNLLINSWDSVRANAMRVLDMMPKPLPGIATPRALGRLLWWAVRLSCSPRVRECDAGALLLQATFRIYVQHLGWTVPLLQWASPGAKPDGATTTGAGAGATAGSGSGAGAGAGAGETASVSDPELFAVAETVQLLRRKTDALAGSLDRLARPAAVAATTEGVHATVDGDGTTVAVGLLEMVKDDDAPMVHGVMLSLRYMLGEVNLRRKVRPGADTAAQWRELVASIVSEVTRAFTAVLAVVAEDFHEDGAAMEAPGDAGLSKGRVDCRGHLIMAPADGDGAGEATASGDGAEAELAVTAAWLVVKECTMLLGALVAAAPLPTTDGPACTATASDDEVLAADVAEEGWLLPSATVATVCSHLVRAMLTLKHIGGICFVATGWQMVCEVLLGQEQLRPCLRAIPVTWLGRLLGRLQRAEQQFILRRSSGFAMAFQSVFRAEPPACKAQLLCGAVPKLLDLASAGAGSDAAGAATHSDKARVSAAVHALNVLKLLFQDRALAEDLQPFVTRAFSVAVAGFRCVCLASCLVSCGVGDDGILWCYVQESGVGRSKLVHDGVRQPCSEARGHQGGPR